MKEPPQNASEAVRRLNPHLYGQTTPVAADKVVKSDCRKRRIRQSQKPLMNKLEKRFKFYMESHLGRSLGCCAELKAQCIRFKLANGLWYKPDFTFIYPDGRWYCYEVKGPHSFRGGFENLKMAASKYPEIQWMLFWEEHGKWLRQEVIP